MPTFPTDLRSLRGPSGRLVLVLIAVWVLDSADKTLVGALAPQLRDQFHLSKTEIGVLATTYTVSGALATMPFGMLVDRFSRTRLLAVACVLWAVAMLAGAAATTLGTLLVARAFLGVLQASVGPAVPSLVGDVVPEDDRSRVFAVVGAGKMIGLGVGYAVAGVIGAAYGWRWGFALLAAPAVLLALALAFTREPPRATAKAVEALSLREAARHVLRIRTNVVVMIAGGIGQFFFAGISAFAVIYAGEQWGVSQGTADALLPILAVTAIGGMLGGAALSDRLRQKGFLSARIWLPAISFVLAAAFALPAIVTTDVYVAAPLIAIGVGFLNAATPPLDAVRIDVVRPDLRGRANAISTLILFAFEGSAPTIFGFASDHLSGGLTAAYLVTLPALVLNGVLLAACARAYPDDHARAAAADDQAQTPVALTDGLLAPA